MHHCSSVRNFRPMSVMNFAMLIWGRTFLDWVGYLGRARALVYISALKSGLAVEAVCG